MDRFQIANLFAFFAILQRFKPLFYTFILHLAQPLRSIPFGAPVAFRRAGAPPPPETPYL